MNEIPLSNLEVLKVLKARKKHTKISKDFQEYLELIKPNEDIYNMERLRTVKDISPETLCIIANMQDITMIDSSSDRRKLERVKD